MSYQDKIFAIGEHLAGIGFALHWLKPCSKEPIKTAWTSSPRLSWEEIIQDYQAGYNLGCRTGEASQFDDNSGLIVFDIDLKGGSNYQATALNQLKQILNRSLDDLPFVISPRGLHYYARCPLNLMPSNIKLAESTDTCSVKIKGEMQQRPSWQLELMTTGRQIVLPPSIHPETKTPYQLGNRWVTDSYTDIPLLDNATVTRLSAYKRPTARLTQPSYKSRKLNLLDYDIDSLNISDIAKQKIKAGAPKGARSETIFYVCIEMLTNGISDEVICSVLSDSRYKLSEKALEERSNCRQSAAEWVDKYNISPAKASTSPPILLRPDKLAAAEPPTKCLGELGGIIDDVAAGIQAPKAIALQSCLAALTLLAQGNANIVSKEVGYIPTSLYFITIAGSGDRKTSIDKFFLTPIRAHENALIEAYNKEHSRFQMEKKATSAKETNLLKSKNSTKTDIKDITDQLQKLPDPIKPRYPMLLVEEPTYEGLVKQLDEAYPSLGLFSSEGGRFFGGHGMNTENIVKTIAGLSSIWDGESITRSRASEPAKRIKNRRMSLHLMVQPIVLERVVDEGLLDGQGFLSRVLISYPESIAGNRFYADTDILLDEMLNRYNALIRPLLQKPLKFNAQSGDIIFCTLEISESAHRVWIEFYNETEAALGRNGRYHDISGFASKAAEQARRLAAVLTLVENPDTLHIEFRWMEAAIQLMRYYLEERLRIFNIGFGDPNIDLAEQVLEKLLKEFRNTGRTVFCLEDIYKNMRSIRNVKKARVIFNILEKHYYIHKLPNGGDCNGEHKKEAWRLNSTLK